MSKTKEVRDEKEIDLREIFGVIFAAKWIIIASAIIGALVFALVSMYAISPKYQSTSMIYILTSADEMSISISDLQAGSSLAGDYEQMIYSRPVLEKVIDNLKLNMDYEQLKNYVNVTNKTNTRMLRITVTYTDPTLAMQIANELANVSKKQIADVMMIEEPQIVETAIIPSTKSGPNTKKNAILGGLLGFLVAVAIFIVRHLLNDTVTTADDVERYFELNTLAAIPLEGVMDDGHGTKKKKHRFHGVRK